MLAACLTQLTTVQDKKLTTEAPFTKPISLAPALTPPVTTDLGSLQQEVQVRRLWQRYKPIDRHATRIEQKARVGCNTSYAPICGVPCRARKAPAMQRVGAFAV